MEKIDFAPEPSEKKVKPNGKLMFIAGILTGMLLFSVILFAGINIYYNETNRYLVLGPNGVNSAKTHEVLDEQTADKVDELMAYVDVYYNDKVKTKKVRDGIYKGTIAGLGDPYSAYYTAEEYKEQTIATGGTYCGIGVSVSKDPETKKMIAEKVYDDTPAKKAGIEEGDYILEVDGLKATDSDLTKFVKKIRGEEGSTTHLKVEKKATGKVVELDVERKNIDFQSVSSRMLDGQIGYIRISEFQGTTAKQFESALSELQKDDMKGLIVDLRGNTGGRVAAVVQILDDILPEGTIVYTEDKYGKRDTYTSDKRCIDIPMAVLVDGDSASASEIFAGAIKDYQYGTLIGTRTFGKGIVQSVFPLEDGDALKLTTAKYYTPKGHYIHKKGIQPDIKLKYKYTGSDKERYDIKYDNQVQKAVEVLSGQLEK